MKEIVKIKIAKIVQDEKLNQEFFNEEMLNNLAQSIKNNGLIEPIMVRKDGNNYKLIAGAKRLKACQLNGDKEIEAIVLEMDEDEAKKFSLTDNLQRENINVLKQALAMKQLMKAENLTQEELAKRLGYRQSTVANKLRLLKLPENIQEAIGQNVLSERHARALLNVPENLVQEVFETIVKRNYTVSKTEEYIRELVSNPKRKGVSNSIQIGINTLKQAYDLCRKSGIDADFNQSEYDDSIKITIRIKK